METSYQIHHGHNMDVLATYPTNHFDSIVTDPPYGLSFMNKHWDYDVPSEALWRECLRVLKPGGHLLAFGGSRTYHRMAVRIEDAGFELRDQIMWLYGSGFPKSLDVSKAIDKAAGAERAVIGPPTRHGGGTNGVYAQDAWTQANQATMGAQTAPATAEAQQWAGWGTALKPAHEPIVVARKPLSEKTVAANVLRWGTGGLNMGGCRIGTTGGQTKASTTSAGAGWTGRLSTGQVTQTGGRFPANLIHDGSEAVLAEFGEACAAARFFYCAKASAADRGQSNTHPTVKPTDLMRYLCRLITPAGGLVLDPFCGSGSTGKAALLEGLRFVGIEREAEYVAIAGQRLRKAQEALGLFGQPTPATVFFCSCGAELSYTDNPQQCACLREHGAPTTQEGNGHE